MLENLTMGLIACLGALLAASASDLRTREVPDWVSFALMFFAGGYALILSIFHQNVGFLINTLAGGAVGFLIGLFMFYAGQWGGGDSKLVIGICAILGITIPPISGIQSGAAVPVFLANTLLVGAVYGILYTLTIAILNFKKILSDARKRFGTRTMIVLRSVSLILIISAITFHLVSKSPQSLAALLLSFAAGLMLYTWMLVTSVEKAHMIRELPVEKLTEGDWVAEPVLKNGKVIFNPTKTGIDLEGIKLLKKHSIRTVVVKEGIPFVPSFLIAFAITLYFGNWFAYIF